MSKIVLAVNGVKYDGWLTASVSTSIEQFCSTFSFSTTVKENPQLVVQNNLKLQDEVTVFIDDVKKITGYIEKLNISYDSENHSITVQGRDRTGDLVDSSILTKSYKHSNFESLANNVLNDNGYNHIKIINNVSNLPALPQDLQVATIQETIIGFLDKYAKTVQVLLTTNEEGNIVITRETKEDLGGILVSKNNNIINNILGGSIELSSTNRFRYIEVATQGNNNSQTENSVDQRGKSIDKTIRNPRRKVIVSTTPNQDITLNELALWNSNLRIAKGTRYSCKVQGFKPVEGKKKIWEFNTLAQVDDERCQLSGQFLIQGVTYEQSNAGSTTTLSIVNKGAFELSSLIASNNNFANNLVKKDNSTDFFS